MNNSLKFLNALLLASLTALSAAEPKAQRHPFLTAKDPNLSRAFRIATGDLTSNVVPLAAISSLSVAPLPLSRWEAVAARATEVAGTGDVVPGHVAFLIAGLDYGMYQYDVMKHATDGADFFESNALRGALLATLQPDEGGSLSCHSDYITGLGWSLGAWSHYLYTGDRAFLKVALAATLSSISFFERNEFDPKLNLFRGPAMGGDGISSYPDFWSESMKGVGHIKRWPEFNPDKKVSVGLGLPLHALSTNCTNYEVYRLTARMQEELGLPVDPTLLQKAERLKAAINQLFWSDALGRYRFLVDPFGGSDQQEGTGNAFAVLFGIASPEQTKRIMAHMHVTPQGLPWMWPIYPRYVTSDPMTFGQRNSIWPQVNGAWALAAAGAGRVDLFALELKKLADRACRTNQFAEIYHPITGDVYGGISDGRTKRSGDTLKAFIAARLGGEGESTPEAFGQLFPPVPGKEGINLWQSCGRNTFSATAYLHMVIHGLCGLRLETDGITFHPTVPKGVSPVAVYELPYRQAELEVHITGEGQQVRRITINGKEARSLPTTATGKQVVKIEMAAAGN